MSPNLVTHWGAGIPFLGYIIPLVILEQVGKSFDFFCFLDFDTCLISNNVHGFIFTEMSRLQDFLSISFKKFLVIRTSPAIYFK